MGPDQVRREGGNEEKDGFHVQEASIYEHSFTCFLSFPPSFKLSGVLELLARQGAKKKNRAVDEQKLEKTR